MASASLGADGRIAVPTTDDVTKATASLKEVFKADFAKSGPANRKALAIKLLQQGKATTDDPASRYALLLHARDIAAKVGDPTTAMAAADELAEAFQVPRGDIRSAIAAPLIASAATTTGAKMVAEVLLAAADELWSHDEWPAVIELLNNAVKAADLAKSTPLTNQAIAKRKRAVALKAELAKVAEHQNTLKTNPDDADANLGVGRYTLFVRHNPEGIAYLAKGSDSKLKAVAEKELKNTSPDETEKVALGDAWYELITETDPVAKLGIQTRALHWYSSAMPDLKGLTKTKTEKRVLELQNAVDAQASASKRWYSIRKAIAEQEIKKWNTVGGTGAKATYEEIPAEGAILIGFNYATTTDGKYLKMVQPIFLASRGEVVGKEYGQVPKGASVEKIKAKAGYAVGAIYTRGGLGIDAFKPIFMRITEAGLDVNDKYEAPQYGANGGSPGTFGGDGNFIIGVHGKVTDNGGLGAISAVTVAGKK
jgi:hypothetical protein